MDGKAEFLIMGSIAAVVVVIIAVKGKGTTIGATFSNPDSASVAAVTSAGASEIDSINKLTLSKMQTAASTIVAIAQLQTGLDTAKVNAGAAEYGEAQATQQVGLQTSAATKQVGLETAAQDYAALQSATASIKTTATSAAAQEAIAKLNDSASTAAAKIN
ncbi:MAG: hypothetical protein IAI50_15490, partial [Candidatus Eremiobacteraeota bacterium]|nr:hypothetical protein [Candidatus Eremiobacteraeota bacterium]